MKHSYLSRILPVLAVLIACVVLLGCASHRATEGPPTSQEVRTLIIRDTVRDTLISRDTVSRFQNIYQRDSMATRISGDTVFVERWHTCIEKDNQQQAHHQQQSGTRTSMTAATDTVRIRIPVPVERKLTKWEKAKQDVGGIAIVVLALAIYALSVWLGKRVIYWARGRI